MRSVVVRPMLLLAGLGIGACRDTTSPCGPSSKPAMIISALDGGLNDPIVGATIVYDRHGDDSLTLLHPNVAVAIPLGSKPGIYDFRVIKSGYADWLLTNVVVDADGCDPKTIEMQVFMQKLP